MSNYNNERLIELEAEIERLRLAVDSWKREAELNAECCDQLHVTMELLRKHGIHIEGKWCWCGPTVETVSGEGNQ